MSGARHLVGRFFGSLRPGGPPPSEETWVRSVLRPGEVQLWSRLSGPDRRHAVGVARRVERALGADADQPVLAAALLHDAGKVESGLGTYGRVVATIAAKVAGHEMADRWQRGRGFTRRVGLYLNHPAIGADLLELAGSAPLTVAWAREHHLPADAWSLPRSVADALKAADDD